MAYTNMYYLREGASFAIITLYMDDTYIASNRVSLLDSVKRKLHDRFLLFDLGPAHYLLSL